MKENLLNRYTDEELWDELKERKARSMTPAHHVRNEVAYDHNVPVWLMIAKRGNQPRQTAARHEWAYRLRKELEMSLKQTAKEIGWTDHTTVLNAIKRHEERMEIIEDISGHEEFTQ